MTTPADHGPGARARLHEPFYPQRTRRVTSALAAAQLIVLTAVALLMPHGGAGFFQWYDRLAMVGVGLAVGAFLLRFARSRAVADERGLSVRNLAGTRFVEWAQIVGVRFGSGDPWVVLDLSDADQLAVMAVQRADGERGAAEARRLATLVALHSS